MFAQNNVNFSLSLLRYLLLLEVVVHFHDSSSVVLAYLNLLRDSFAPLVGRRATHLRLDELVDIDQRVGSLLA